MRRVRRKGGNKEKVFGCDLMEHLNASGQEVPQVLRCCSEFVEHHGIVDGIYRLSGVSSNIQKLRGEFENDGTPDLNKDVYLQDIHCVSSLCKAYFRELPNPLLTYQLYDKFAEAVGIQLEEERLVKIGDVLKDLAPPHYRTLEFLMRHLVRMASYSSETNMHARNLAIVWAPNLLRSKDIEATGFNGTAAFMEVRVQSIVVEFILTHVPQLFPDPDLSKERRKSLPSPSAFPKQDDMLLTPVPTAAASYGNISPGDGPLPIRPYHAIIEGTDKRKGSLKGRKWMSIFNIGGRFPDPRRRHKPSAKVSEKERPALRPARSMDSLSSPSYPNEGTRRSGQRPPSTNMSPLVTATPQPGSDVTVSAGALGGSEYAVTYRRGTGLVSGSAGVQGTYTALDPEGLGLASNDTVQSRSPGISSKAGRRAAMHITGPTIVTVPLHITSNLALGVLQRGGADRIIHRGRDKNGGDKVESKVGAEKAKGVMEWNMEENKKVEEEEKSHKEKSSEEDVDMAENTVATGGAEDKTGEAEEEGGKYERKQAKSQTSNSEEDPKVDANDAEQAVEENDYMDMKGGEQDSLQPEGTEHEDNGEVDDSEILTSTEVGGDNQNMSGYIQDNFEFLDQMDCSAPDHIDCSVSYQVNEFSVEPPGHSDDEYEAMAQAQSTPCPAEPQSRLHPGPQTHTQNQSESNPHRPLSLDLHSRHTKSLSLPYMTSPVHGPEESFSDDEVTGDESDGNEYSSEEDESMFVKSLPSDFFLNTISGFELETDEKESSTHDRVPVHHTQSSEERDCHPPKNEHSACTETAAGEQEQVEVKDREDTNGLEENETIEEQDEDKVHQGGEQQENDTQSGATEEHLSIMEDAQSEKSLTSEISTTCCVEFPLPASEDTDESCTVASVSRSCDGENATEIDREEGEDGMICNEMEDMCQESDENTREEPLEGKADIKPDSSTEQDTAICGTHNDIWKELEDIVSEVIEDEEKMQSERESVAAQADMVKDEQDEELAAKVSEEKMMEVDKEEAKKIEVRIEVEEEPMEMAEGEQTSLEIQQEFKDDETQRATHEKMASQEEAQEHDGGEVLSESTEQRVDEQLKTAPSEDKQFKEVGSDMKESRENEKSDNTIPGVESKLISSQPKIYQVKAVPVVPPKPQHCRITALTIRQQQQQQQRERRDADRGRDNTLRVPAEQDKICTGETVKDGDLNDESTEIKERPKLRGDSWERERRRDRAEARNSPLSMCFDEAVAIATMRREKERVREGDGEVEGLGK
ncbi:rho GTPase-activating protein 30 [Archocentrus centrarchus]|uniref:rho GTPase-activating protein 30 n=1 Tax=Archocentrus centrarchus TaxID=63155 RepID=UPI0011E9EC4F|nr:rho GTPase-activating protein 30-like [Archocentrus centrarchus]XP_030607964.1 rho GTPase-activating protein 30-like [Archocentrus centrarchus]